MADDDNLLKRVDDVVARMAETDRIVAKAMSERPASERRKEHLDNLRMACLTLVHGEAPNPVEAARELFDFVADTPKERQFWIVQRSGFEEDKSYLQSALSWRSWSMKSFATVFGSEREAIAEIARIGDSIDGGMIGAFALNITNERWFWQCP